MRFKIAFLTILALNVLGVAAYWGYRVLYMESVWFQHTPVGMRLFTDEGNAAHQCENGHFRNFLGTISCQLLMLFASAGLAYLFYKVCTKIWLFVYNRIDKLIPEKKP
jgi:hypothetical protein